MSDESVEEFRSRAKAWLEANAPRRGPDGSEEDARGQASIPAQDGCAPSVPMMRMPRCSSNCRNCATPGCSRGTEPRSTTTGRASKKFGDRSICASRAASQRSSGTSGANTKAMMERPRSLIRGFVSELVTIPTYPLTDRWSTGIRGARTK